MSSLPPAKEKSGILKMKQIQRQNIDANFEKFLATIPPLKNPA
jgi:hypothetical protein